jgi:uncharacterized protein (TIGR03118 family)
LRSALSRRLAVLTAVIAAVALGGAAFAPTPASAQSPFFDFFNLFRPATYTQTNLVSDQMHHAELQDGQLVNAWGVSFFPGGPLWVSDNGTGVTAFYTGDVGNSPVTKIGAVTIPVGAPTGQVHNSTNDFPLTGDTNPAVFLFDSDAGRISGWNPAVNGASAVVKVTNPNAVYKGLAIAATPQGSRLYAANFRQATIDVFDGTFQPVMRPGAFVDPFLPRGYAPFNVQALDGKIYVAYAQQDAAKMDEVAGPGKGFVDAYTTDGHLISRLFVHAQLDAPWGLAIAPHDFGRFSDSLLVGNFGNGRIHAFDRRTGFPLGTLRDAQHRPIVIDGLWALDVGNGTFGAPNQVVFSARPADESHGLVGTLTATR